MTQRQGRDVQSKGSEKKVEYYLEIYDKDNELIVSISFKERKEALILLEKMELLNGDYSIVLSMVTYENIYNTATRHHEKIYVNEVTKYIKDKKGLHYKE